MIGVPKESDWPNAYIIIQSSPVVVADKEASSQSSGQERQNQPFPRQKALRGCGRRTAGVAILPPPTNVALRERPHINKREIAVEAPSLATSSAPCTRHQGLNRIRRDFTFVTQNNFPSYFRISLNLLNLLAIPEKLLTQQRFVDYRLLPPANQYLAESFLVPLLTTHGTTGPSPWLSPSIVGRIRPSTDSW